MQTGLSTGQVEKASYVPRGGRLVSELQSGILTPLNGLTATVGFCRLTARLHPTPDSNIVVETWLPDGWNGKLVGVGGGGFSGGLTTAALTLRGPLEAGYAGVATDVGHPATETAEWAFGHREKLIDYGHRANHLAAVSAKEEIARFYGRAPGHAYFSGCSNGGRDALMEVSRFPDDYDGVIAGAPAAPWTRLAASFVYNHQAVFGSGGASELGKKLGLINRAVIRKCDAADGVADGVIENPRACRFDPAELQCKPGDDPKVCLSGAEVAATRAIYRGPRLAGGKLVLNGFSVGGETTGWDEWITSPKSSQANFGVQFFRWFVYGNGDWNAADFNLDRDFAASTDAGQILNSDNPDIRAFTRRGGKLIMYQGWNDAAIPPEATIGYFEAARRKSDPHAASTRLFMMPGMGHCFGGPGPNSFDMLPELDDWVERGKAPERVIATKYPNDLLALIKVPQKAIRTRPVCSWPKVARYNGTGSTDDAANFTCAKPGETR